MQKVKPIAKEKPQKKKPYTCRISENYFFSKPKPKFFNPNNTSTLQDLINNISHNQLSYESILSTQTEEYFYNIDTLSKNDPLFTKVIIGKIFGIITEIKKDTNIYHVSLQSIVSEENKIIFHTFINNYSIKILEQIEVGNIILLSNVERGLGPNMHFFFNTNYFSRILVMSKGSESNFIPLSPENIQIPKIDSFISLFMPKIIRYKLNFFVNVMGILECRGIYEAKIGKINGFPNIQLKAKLCLDDGSYQAFAYVENDLLVKMLNLSNIILKKLDNILEEEGRINHLLSFLKKVKANSPPLEYLFQKQFLISAIPFCNCKEKMERVKGSYVKRLDAEYKDPNQKLKESHIFINGDLCYERNGDNVKQVVAKPLIKITNILSIY